MANDATRRARKVLLPYAGMRARNASDKSRYDFCSKTFNSLAKELQTDYGSGEPSERFDVSFMVFDEEMKALRIVCGYLSGSPLPSRWQGFSFQPGIGIAGSCFKWGDRVTLFIRGSKWPEDPGLYTEIAGFNQLNERHQVLLSLPIYEKSYSKRLTQSALSSKSEKEMQMEARRHIIGVMNVGSNSIQSKLYQLRRSGTSLETDPAADRIVPAIVAKCQMMADLFILHSEER